MDYHKYSAFRAQIVEYSQVVRATHGVSYFDPRLRRFDAKKWSFSKRPTVFMFPSDRTPCMYASAFQIGPCQTPLLRITCSALTST